MELFLPPGLEGMLAEVLSFLWAAETLPLLLWFSIQETGKEGNLKVQSEVWPRKMRVPSGTLQEGNKCGPS